MLELPHPTAHAMNLLAKRIWIAGFLLSAIAVGLPYWTTPYDRADLPNALVAPGLVFIPLTAAALRFLGSVAFWRAVALGGAALPAIVVARIAAGILVDPTSHNLWPFELIIAGLFGFLCALVGALFGWGLRKLMPQLANLPTERPRP